MTIIIINNDTGKIKVSDEIIKKDFSSKVTLDYNNMIFESDSSLNLKNIFLILLITIIVEVVIDLLMKYIKHVKVIMITNIVTNILLQLLLNVISGNYFIKLILFEILVVFDEYLIYKKFMKSESTSKILIYTLIANMITASLTFAIK